MAYLIFVDTNVWLDFYRTDGREGSLSILEHVDNHHDRFITSHQVEMEFKKNRQKAISLAPLDPELLSRVPGREGRSR